MAKTQIWDGSAWRDLQGPQGDPGPTVVSADAGNVCKLGADGRISVQPADMDARWVNVVGDTMTGPLSVRPTAAVVTPNGHVQVVSDNSLNASISVQSYGSNPLIRFGAANGTVAAPTGLTNGRQVLGVLPFGSRPDGTWAGGGGIYCNTTADAANGVPLSTRWQVLAGDAGGTVGLAFSTTSFTVAQRDPRSAAGAYNALILDDSSCSMWAGGPASSFDVGFLADDNGSLVMRSTKAEFASDTVGNVYIISKQAGRMNDNVFFYTAGNGNLAFQDCDHVTIGGVGSLTYGFECSKDAIFRSTVDIVGNITATGTAHSFAANSITRSAVSGISEPELDARYVNLTGDTMTGTLNVSTGSNSGWAILVNRADGNGVGSLIRSTDVTRRTVGISADVAGPSRLLWAVNIAHGGGGVDSNIALFIASGPPKGPNNYAINSGSPADSVIAGNLGLGWYNPTHQLEVGGDTMLRGDLEVTGDITSTGTAHSFAANSIPVTAISGAVNKAGDTLTGPLNVNLNSAGAFLVQLENGASYTKLNGGVFTTAKFGPRPQNDGFCTVLHSWGTDASNNYWGNDYSAGSLDFSHSIAGARTNVLSISNTGNLTSTGTAHSFANGSIPSPAVIGSTAFTPANSAAAGVDGSMRWDEDFLYVRVASGWKRVALTAF